MVNLDAEQWVSSSTSIGTQIFNIEGNNKKAYPLVMVTNSDTFQLTGGDKRMDKLLCFYLCIYLRNEFHFSGVHGAMNRSGSRAK